MAGPLSGVRIIEVGGIGPGPFAGMVLADHGAEVIRIERPGNEADMSAKVLTRSRRIVTLDLKSQEGVDTVRSLARHADGLIEGFRPGTMERLGLGPDVLLAAHPKLVYGRMTGWGQSGPNASTAGHDLNYISLAGAAHAIGPAGGKPTPPLALVGDFGGGGMLLAFSMTAALLHAQKTGQGQVIDCAIADGARLLMSAFYSGLAQGQWRDERGVNTADGGCPFYDMYETSDGRYISIASIEPQFYAQLLARLQLEDDAIFANQQDRSVWPQMRDKLAAAFATKSRDEWCRLLEHTDVCFAPVLSMREAPSHPHAVARNAFVELDATVQPAPAPKYSVTQLDHPRSPQVMNAEQLRTLMGRRG